MLSFELPRTGAGGCPLELLAIGPHADDIEIGCGGTILSLVQSRPDLRVHWLVLSGAGERADEARRSAAEFLDGLDAVEVEVLDFRDGFFPTRHEPLKEHFEQLKADVAPDLVLAPHRHDLHQDHRLVAELTWNTFRSHLVLEYEIPKYDGDLGHPNVFVALDRDTCARKAELIAKHFPSQAHRSWLDDDLFLGLARVRGLEAASPTGYAEAFHVRKLALST